MSREQEITMRLVEAAEAIQGGGEGAVDLEISAPVLKPLDGVTVIRATLEIEIPFGAEESLGK